MFPGSSLRRGDTIAGRYRLESLVRGGRASALLGGVDTTKKTPVAIEVLIASGEEADAVGVRFLSAARRTASLESAHAARVLDAGVTVDGHPYVVREWMRERSLAELLATKGSIATSFAVDIALDVCDALAEAHAHRLLHGDLGADAIHLELGSGPPSKVKVTGIGTAHTTLALRAPDELTLRAPEQLDPSQAIDARTDIWALGVVLYTMLAGGSPFATDSPSGLSLSVALDEPAQLAGVPDELADIVESCLAKNPALRPMSMHRLAEELAKFASNPIASAERVAAREHLAPESSPTIIAGKTYDALRKEAALTDADADATAPRNALESDAIRLQAQPSLRDVDVEIEVEPSVRDVSKVGSLPPPAVSRTLPPPPSAARDAITVLTRKPAARRLRATALAAAAAFVVVGVVAFVQLASSSKPTAAAASPAEPPPAAAREATPAAAPEPAAAPAPAPTTIAANALPDSKPAAAPAAPMIAKPRATTKLAPAAPAREAAPAAAAPAAPVQPEPKASDDDLRRFLDDRR